MSRGPIPDKPADRPTAREVAELIADFYAMDGHCVGGCLHIVLDDANLEDGHIRYCLNVAQGHDTYFCGCERRVCVEGVALAEKMLALSITQRRRALFLAASPPVSEEHA